MIVNELSSHPLKASHCYGNTICMEASWRGGKGHLPASTHPHPYGLRVPLSLAAVPPSLAAGWEKSQAAPSADSSNLCDASKQAG